MNKIIQQQLKKVTATKIKLEGSNRIIIPKTIKILNQAIKIGEVYDIELNPMILDPVFGSTLSANWNGNIFPKYKEYTVEIVDSLGKMVKVNGVAINDNTSRFEGWVPNDGFTVLRKH